MKKLFTTIVILLLIGMFSLFGEEETDLTSFMGLQFNAIMYPTRDLMYENYPMLEEKLPEMNKKPKYNKENGTAAWPAKGSYIGDMKVNIWLYFEKTAEDTEDVYVFKCVEITFQSERFDDFQNILIDKYGSQKELKQQRMFMTGINLRCLES